MTTDIEQKRMPIGDSTGSPKRSPSDGNRRDGLETAGYTPRHGIAAGLLTGGGDKPYALGLASALAAQNIRLDFIGSDEIDGPELHETPSVNFLNLRGNQKANVGFARKALRLLAYYGRLVRYAAKAEPRVLHILWNERFEYFDRTALMIYYRLLGKRIVLTAHNVNAGKRDGNDTVLNRLTLRAQYRLAHHIFVHTEKMQRELVTDFGISAKKVSVIPFGINKTVPNTLLTAAEAKRRFGLDQRHKVILFFGNIAPYKGTEHLVAAFGEIVHRDPDYRLIIAGRPKDCDKYWAMIRQTIVRNGLEDQIIQRIEYIPDEAVEDYFKAADVLVLPYTHIFQSGVLFLGYNFGLPVIATDVGSMREDIVEGETGFLCGAGDARELARKIEEYFKSDLFKQLETRRIKIQEFANERYSWDKVGENTARVYAGLLGRRSSASAII